MATRYLAHYLAHLDAVGPGGRRFGTDVRPMVEAADEDEAHDKAIEAAYGEQGLRRGWEYQVAELEEIEE